MRRVADLGSGDGRIVIALAQHGFHATGYELNPWLVWWSRLQAYRAGVGANTAFRCRNLWKVDFSGYEGVCIFGVAEMMPELRGKLLQELTPEAHIVACRFPMRGVVQERAEGRGIDTVWLYKPLPAPDSPVTVAQQRAQPLK